MKKLFLLLVLVVVGTAQTKNPYCDFHNTYFYKVGQEYPNGNCYDIYSHTYTDFRMNTRSHRMAIPCKQ